MTTWKPPEIDKVLEKDVEARLVRKVKEIGGDCEKFSSPNKRAVPDRICTYPFEVIHFIECKRPGAKATKAQLRDHEKRRAKGFTVRVVDSYDAVDSYIHDTLKVLAEHGHGI